MPLLAWQMHAAPCTTFSTWLPCLTFYLSLFICHFCPVSSFDKHTLQSLHAACNLLMNSTIEVARLAQLSCCCICTREPSLKVELESKLQLAEQLFCPANRVCAYYVITS